MNNETRYLYDVNPGTVSGVAFVTDYELPKLHRWRNDDLPEIAGTPTEENRNWTKRVIRLPSAFHRLVRARLGRKAAKAASAA